MGVTERSPLPVTTGDLRHLSRVISSQSDGWQQDTSGNVYVREGIFGRVEARRHEPIGTNNFSVDLITGNRQWGVTFDAPESPADKPASLTAFRQETDGQFIAVFGTEARQIFWAIRHAVEVGLQPTERH